MSLKDEKACKKEMKKEGDIITSPALAEGVDLESAIQKDINDSISGGVVYAWMTV